jgi:hypothetical protein
MLETYAFRRYILEYMNYFYSHRDERYDYYFNPKSKSFISLNGTLSVLDDDIKILLCQQLNVNEAEMDSKIKFFRD